MAFVWKDKKDIYKGEGIYHLTFCVVNRIPLLGTLRALETVDTQGHIATVDPTELGKTVYFYFNELRKEYPALEVLAKQVMPDHFHVVVWMHEGFEGSIKMVARHFAQGCSKVARRIAEEGGLLGSAHASAGAFVSTQSDCVNKDITTKEEPALNKDITTKEEPALNKDITTKDEPALNKDITPKEEPALNKDITPKEEPALNKETTVLSPEISYDCGNGANTLFSKPFIRTLAHKGQLHSMIHYVHANPDNAWLRKQNPQLYVIRRQVNHAGLLFDTMGKARLLDWPSRQVIALSRSLSEDQIKDEIQKALYNAERGAVTYTAAINTGEKQVAKAIRGAGYPLVILMLEGFPKEGTEMARYYHPNGIYHKICGEGRLYLMAPHADNYENKSIIELTDQELQKKAKEKHVHYYVLPHDSKRWKMIAGNIMLNVIASL